MAGQSKSIYIETTILSFLCADPSLVQATFEKQRHTLQWWDIHRPNYRTFISNEVIIEISKGSPEFIRRRLERAQGLPLIERVAQDVELAQELIARRLIPPSADVDAVHLAIAVRTKMDFLLTWNLKHLANPQTLPLVYNHLKATGRHMPAITTPIDLMGSL